ncbi:MAG: transketolase C-terminal domain-containing protein, partial [Candidatus Brocadiia bacterium]
SADAEPEVQVGKAEVCREGDDATILAYGMMTGRALEAARILAEEDGLEVGVINARFACPLDREAILDAVRESPAVVVAEDHCVAGGFGSAVLELLAEEGVPGGRVHLAGVPRRFIRHAPREVQLSWCELDAEGLAERVRRALLSTEGG